MTHLSEVKSPLLSKTLWVNVLTGAVALLTWASGTVPPQYQVWITVGLAAANFLLRFITTQPILSA